MDKHDQMNVEDLSRIWPTARAAVLHALSDMEAALRTPTYQRKRGRIYYEMRRDMPYVIHDTDTPGVQILVNRSYKPLGSNEPSSGPHLNYGDYPNAHVRLTPEQIANVVSTGRDRGLFGDENPPWKGRVAAKAYARRLRCLLSYLTD